MVGNLEIPPLPPLFSLPVEIPPATQATESEEFIFIEPISFPEYACSRVIRILRVTT